MKRTILATAIALTSFGAMAKGEVIELPPVQDPVLGGQTTVEQKAQFVETMIAKTGAEGYTVSISDSGHVLLETPDGLIVAGNQLKDALAEVAYDNKVTREERRADLVDSPRVPTNPKNPTMPIEEDDAIIVEPIHTPEDKLREAGKNLVEAGKNAKENHGIDGSKGQGQVIAHSQAAQAQTQSQIDELYALGEQNASDIDTLFSEVDRLDTRIDQTQALNAATVNARPMVANGMTAFGAGVGYAGSEAALAIGVAHSFVDTGWSASGTLAASSDDVVVGGGVQYAF